MYFKKRRDGKDPFFSFGKKRKVYHYFFERGRKLGFDMFLASGPDSYKNNLKFKNPLYFDGRSFVRKKGTIAADAIYDRSGGTSFPNNKIDKKVLNCSKFKILCNDKNKMYGYFTQFMPKSLRIRRASDLNKALERFDPNSLVVLKPANGLGGKGILIEKPTTLRKAKLDEKKEYILQEFIDTSCGIKGLTKEKHDLRVVVINGKVTLSHIRTPKKGEFLANASQGATIKEIPLKKIPVDVLNIVRKVQKIVDKRFQRPIYSVDIGVTRNGPFIFELNDQIGFPNEEMENAKKFVDRIISSLKEISQN